MTSTTTGHPARRLARRAVVALTSAALAGTGVAALTLATAAPSEAALGTVHDATFSWDFNNEATSGAFAPGTWNLMSAGKIGNPGSGGNTLVAVTGGSTWSNARPAGWSAQTGNVSVEDLQADGGYAPATFATTRTNTAGANANTSGVRGETRLSFAGGTGHVDPVTNTASISWDGDATLLFYSGMTFFYVSDPELSVASDGTGTVTATAGGYATSMSDPTQWTALPDTEVTLAKLSGVDVTPTGVAATPTYREVPYTAPAGAVTQNTTSATWGAFPQGFIDFQQSVGQGSYWYSSGGAADARKVANPLAVAFTTAAAVPTVTVSDTDVDSTGAHVVTVTGTGFDPTKATGTRPPAAGQPAGTYVAFGRFADLWKPSAGAPGTSRKTSDVKWAAPPASNIPGTVPLSADGSFTTTLTLDKAAADAAVAGTYTGNYGVYTYPGAGATEAAFETFTPVTFTDAVVTPPATTPPATTGPATPSAVTKAATTAVTKVTKRPTTTRGGKAKLTISTISTGSTAGTDRGTAKLVLRSARGTVLKKVRAAKLSTAGVATLALPRLPRGRYTIVAAYAGSATTTATRTTVSFTVK